jgi:hypothetical protein
MSSGSSIKGEVETLSLSGDAGSVGKTSSAV